MNNGISYFAIGADHVARGHRQLPSATAMVFRQVDSKVRVNSSQVIGQLKPQTIGIRDRVAVVVQDFEIQAELFFQSAATGGYLWADGDERAAGIRDVTRDLLQSFQLCDTVGSPSATKPGQHNRTRGAQLAEADVAAATGQVELGCGLADVDRPMSLAGFNQVIFMGVKRW